MSSVPLVPITPGDRLPQRGERLAAGVEAADSMVKSANVTILARQQVGGGLVAILVPREPEWGGRRKPISMHRMC